jgi:hypothetical protein
LCLRFIRGNAVWARQCPQRRLRAGEITLFRAESHTMIHPSLIAIGAIVLVFAILNLIEFKRID